MVLDIIQILDKLDASEVSLFLKKIGSEENWMDYPPNGYQLWDLVSKKIIVACSV